MATESIMGKITFINHDKEYATIEYMLNGKKKTISGNISEQEQLKLKAEKIIKRIHQFHVGDEVSFIINLSARGDKMVADCMEFKFNNALDNLINKSAIENRFVGYLKKVEDEYFLFGFNVDRESSSTFYKADQIDGLLKLLSDEL